MAPPSQVLKFCFNSNCKHVLDRPPKKGWRRRSGDFADLCDPCASAFEEGKFCETFHLNASGWRCCESCGKQIHCGCIVSFHMFVLLDAGGIECISCARKSFILTPNPAWPPPPLFLPVHSDRMKEFSSKKWCHIAGSGPVPWRQAPSFFGSSCSQSDIQPSMPKQVDITSGANRLNCSERLSVASFNNKKAKADASEKLTNDSLKLVAPELHNSGVLNNTGVLGTNSAEQANLQANIQQQSFFPRRDISGPLVILPVSSVTTKEMKDPTAVSSSHISQLSPPHLNGKCYSGHNGIESSVEALIRNLKPPGDARVLDPLPRCYWPRITDLELQTISGNSNSLITPLFEKTLTASDAGSGRLVLPKKCAETYFPPISHSEGLPLIIQDSKGKEWTFHFRFWPNNSSRMYVLEGLTPCMQSLQLQSGDIVIFSRIEPERKLVIEFRKASTASPSNQGFEITNAGNGDSISGDGSAQKSERCEGPCYYSGSVDQAILKDQASVWSKDDKPEYTVTKVLGTKSAFHNKRKNTTLGSKRKRLQIEKEDRIELNLTWEQAQGLLRPPSNHIPSVVVIEGFEFEEYEQDAPVIGRPTITARDRMGENIQWAQCDDCLKWRKVPVDAYLSSRWTCSDNSWDPERSSCLTSQELTAEQFEELLPPCNQTGSKKSNAVKKDPYSLEAIDELDTLANLATKRRGDLNPSSSQTTTKHPRHKPGCPCIVCIQPPSGKGSKHRQTCTCPVCLTQKRRVNTLSMKREKKKSEREAVSSGQMLPDHQNFLAQVSDEKMQACYDIGNSSATRKPGNYHDDDLNMTRLPHSPFKAQIDLNVQPERDEELSPGPDSGGLMKLIQDTTERYLRQQILSSSSYRNSNGYFNGNGIGNESQDGNSFISSHWNSKQVIPRPVSDNNRASTSPVKR